MKRLIIVHGDKGGVGKTYVSQLTAAAFRAVGQPLTLVDGDAKNPGLHRYFDGKPDPVLRINARKPEGIDALFEAFLDAPADLLVDLPAGGSETTAGFVGAGTAAGSIDIEQLLQESNAGLTIVFVIDQNRDSLVALADELQRLPASVTDWIIVRNHQTDAAFTRFDAYAASARMDPYKPVILDMPTLDRRVTEGLVDAKAHIGEIDTVEAASAIMKLRAKSALRVWSAELRKAGLLHG